MDMMIVEINMENARSINGWRFDNIIDDKGRANCGHDLRIRRNERVCVHFILDAINKADTPGASPTRARSCSRPSRTIMLSILPESALQSVIRMTGVPELQEPSVYPCPAS